MSEKKSGDVKELTKEENQELADMVLKPVLLCIDLASGRFPEERLKATLEKMHGHNSALAAWPFAETMDKADAMTESTEVFEKIVELIILRRHQLAEAMERAERSKSTPGQDVLKALGMG